ncbi:MAG: phospho-sugar mutase, partial [Planctomycetales bacterium]|nr:phospho-sugar mutase [Planctomycetales bacterium]NIM08075.1 phospho-sugar mutase [Planctomycetales bacterium]NIN07566.1 phospho-sugar mutase [Planctomycetales bacterium]NIN76677.1 phospho-sugar mutase [Planctomycetales bacterium]NIO33865.1 phospho-sugar mutase [Planctomycetales bacterium]
MSPPDTTQALDRLQAAHAGGQISDAAATNIRAWLTEPQYAEYAGEVERHLVEGQFDRLNKAFWKIIEFGTGGRRGEMYPIGSAVINQRTMGESAAGLAGYVVSQSPPDTDFSCAIAHDTRHHSERFARLSAEIMAAAGFRVYYLQGYRSTPELSFAVRLKNCCCGIMITASHNPPSDNG